MAYINSKGEVVQTLPIHSKIAGAIYGFFSVIYLFFLTIFEPLIGLGSTNNNSNSNGNRNYRPDGRGGSRADDASNIRRSRIAGFGSSTTGPNAPPCASAGG